MLKRKLTIVLAALVMILSASGAAFATEGQGEGTSVASVISVSSAASEHASADVGTAGEQGSTERAESTATTTPAESGESSAVTAPVESTEATDTTAPMESTESSDAAAPAEPEGTITEEGENFDAGFSVDSEETSESIPSDSIVESPEVQPPTVENPIVENPVVAVPVVEVPVAEVVPAVVEAEEATVVILHLFEADGVVCEDYETVAGLKAGESIALSDYSYCDEYKFAECLNGAETVTLEAGDNALTIRYTLKDGYAIL